MLTSESQSQNAHESGWDRNFCAFSEQWDCRVVVCSSRTTKWVSDCGDHDERPHLRSMGTHYSPRLARKIRARELAHLVADSGSKYCGVQYANFRRLGARA